ncbi:hypothetical protein [Streptomyces mirabilis]|uniref:hypothetical protein n=1 Tax=Streptomyces mirabilis TaxID=68239 RepID=UPI0036AA7F19
MPPSGARTGPLLALHVVLHEVDRAGRGVGGIWRERMSRMTAARIASYVLSTMVRSGPAVSVSAFTVHRRPCSSTATNPWCCLARR